MKWLIPSLLLLACATAPVKPAPKSEPRWSQRLQASVYLQCYAQRPSKSFCSCLTFALEQASPDPDAEFTAQDFAKANAICEPEAEAMSEGAI